MDDIPKVGTVPEAGSRPVVPSRWRVWLLAARPATLPASIAPVLVGGAVGASEGGFRPLVFVATLVASLLIQIGTNFANDLSDFHKGADTADRLGPTRVTQQGLVTPDAIKRATILTFGLAMLIGLYLVIVGGWPILAIGLLSILFGVAYTGGPWPLGYHGLGDAFVFIFFGLAGVGGSAYLQSGAFSARAFIAAIPVGLLITNILVVNNLRDIDTDRAAGKHTLAVRIGARATRIQFAAFIVISYAVPLLLAVSGAASFFVLLSWITLPLAAQLAVEAVHRLRVLLLQAAMALVQREEGFHQLRRLFDRARQRRRRERLAAQAAVVQRAVQLGQLALVLFLRELADVSAEHLGELQQHAGGDRALVVLDLAHVAQRQRQPLRQHALAPALLLAQPAQARPDEQLAVSGHFTRFAGFRCVLRIVLHVFFFTSNSYLNLWSRWIDSP